MTDIIAEAMELIRAQHPLGSSEVYDRAVATSQAISLKRIADYLEVLSTPLVTYTTEETVDQHKRIADALDDIAALLAAPKAVAGTGGPSK